MMNNTCIHCGDPIELEFDGFDCVLCEECMNDGELNSKCMDCGALIELGDFKLTCDRCGNELCESCEPYHDWKARVDLKNKKNDEILCPLCVNLPRG